MDNNNNKALSAKHLTLEPSKILNNNSKILIALAISMALITSASAQETPLNDFEASDNFHNLTAQSEFVYNQQDNISIELDSKTATYVSQKYGSRKELTERVLNNVTTSVIQNNGVVRFEIEASDYYNFEPSSTFSSGVLNGTTVTSGEPFNRTFNHYRAKVKLASQSFSGFQQGLYYADDGYLAYKNGFLDNKWLVKTYQAPKAIIGIFHTDNDGVKEIIYKDSTSSSYIKSLDLSDVAYQEEGVSQEAIVSSTPNSMDTCAYGCTRQVYDYDNDGFMEMGFRGGLYEASDRNNQDAVWKMDKNAVMEMRHVDNDGEPEILAYNGGECVTIDEISSSHTINQEGICPDGTANMEYRNSLDSSARDRLPVVTEYSVDTSMANPPEEQADGTMTVFGSNINVVIALILVTLLAVAIVLEDY